MTVKHNILHHTRQSRTSAVNAQSTDTDTEFYYTCGWVAK